MAIGGGNLHFEVEVIETGAALQAKVGKGEITSLAINRAQTVLNNNNVDFVPIASQYTRDLASVIKASHEQQENNKTLVKEITAIVMQLKASAGTFGYPLITRLADITLTFLEKVQTLDDDIIQIVEALHASTKVVITRKIKGEGGTYGTQLETELYNACQRYFLKCKKH